MNIISINYTLVWRFKDHNHIQITRCRKIFNVKTQKQLKCCLNGGVLGYWVASKKFIPLGKINENVELIKETEMPF